MEQKQINPEHVENVLADTIARLHLENAKLKAVIIDLQKDNENLKESLADDAK